MFRGVQHQPFCALLILSVAMLGSTGAQARGLPDFTDLIRSSSPAVVKINTLGAVTSGSGQGQNPNLPPFFRDFFEQFPEPQRRPSAGIGSGFIVSGDGYVVTNHHVVEGAAQIRVRLNDRREYEARVVGSDFRSDLALLKIEEKDLPNLEFANSDDLEVGDWVVAIGSPFDLEYSASAGIVSAIGRSLPSGTGQDYVPFIQTDVAINPGNSGGPLFNLDGKVVGINSQIYTRSGGFMGLSFAVPSGLAMDVIEQLKKNGTVSRGWLGVMIQDVNRSLADSFGLDVPQGALVSHVQKGGPADVAGIQAGDVIVEFADQPIEYSHDLPHVVGQVDPGTEAVARIIRQKQEIRITVEVGTLTQGGQTLLGSNDPNARQEGLGLILKDSDPAALDKLDLEAGILVRRVEPGSPAAQAGLIAGDIIVQIAFQDLSTVAEFERIVSGLETGAVVPILFYRGDTAVFRTIQVDD